MGKTLITQITKQMNNSTQMLPSRLLKFRAWVRNEIMVDVVSIDFNNKCITWYDNQYDKCVPQNKCYEIETFDDIVLMQYTGLTDKNGNEIFEGDIVVFSENSKIHIVKYINTGFVLTASNGNIMVYNFNPNVLKIIGNIYENPELL